MKRVSVPAFSHALAGSSNRLPVRVHIPVSERRYRTWGATEAMNPVNPRARGTALDKRDLKTVAWDAHENLRTTIQAAAKPTNPTAACRVRKESPNTAPRAKKKTGLRPLSSQVEYQRNQRDRATKKVAMDSVSTAPD